MWLTARLPKGSRLPIVFRHIAAIERAVPHGRKPGNRDPGAWQKTPGSVNTAWVQLEPEFAELCRDYPKLEKTNHLQHLGTLGTGNPESFESCSHGAGRVMSRGEAKRRFTLADHRAATEGVECRKDKDVIDETPAAYKDIDAVMDAQRDLVDVVHTLKQVVCVKG